MKQIMTQMSETSRICVCFDQFWLIDSQGSHSVAQIVADFFTTAT